MKNKRGIASEYLPWILISLAVLLILIISTTILKDKGISALESIKGIFRGR